MSHSSKSKAKDLYQELLQLCNSVSNSPSPEISFEALKKLKFIAKTDDIPILDFLFKRQSIAQINEQGHANYSISQEEFVDLVSGSSLDSVLFNKNLEEQRLYVEDFTQLYRALGGKDSTGISKNQLRKNLKNYFEQSGIRDKSVDTEIDEIFTYLKSTDSGNSEVITLQEFVKAMTHENE